MESVELLRVLVTGAAGFIGFHTANALLEQGCSVFGLDNLNHYYDPRLKLARLALLKRHGNFRFLEIALEDAAAMRGAFREAQPRRVIHLAAQAGVRYSITHPQVFVQSNLLGFQNILDECRLAHVEHLVFASSSSVYGLNTKLPFAETDVTDSPANLYGATKKANELMAHAYAHLYGLPCTGLRFFTVYGPWGRPDMAPFIFTKNILEGLPVDVYNNGDHNRDFTYIDDIVDGLLRVAGRIPTALSHGHATQPPFRVYNIGNNRPTPLLDFIGFIERAAGRKATLNFLPKQAGDMHSTYADIGALAADTGFQPSTPVEAGVIELVKWYRDYTKV